MRRYIVCALGLLFPLIAGMAEESKSISTTAEPKEQIVEPKKGVKQIKFQMEPLSNEQVTNGLSATLLTQMVEEQLKTVDLSLNQEIQVPYLYLRIRSIPTGLDIATFIQLGFYEEAMLVRNRSIFNSMTWSQASLISCRPEDLSKEVTDVISVMIKSFTKDYQEAMKPIN